MHKVDCVNSVYNFQFDHYPFIKLDLVIQHAKREQSLPTHYFSHCDLQNLLRQV